MERVRAYSQLMVHNKKYSYMPSDGQVVFNNGCAWIVVFQALNKYNFAVVKYFNGQYTVIEI